MESLGLGGWALFCNGYNVWVKRRFFSVLSAISLLLFVAVVALWVRSYWVGEGFCWRTNGGQYLRLGSQRGGLWYSSARLSQGKRLGYDPSGYQRGPVADSMDGDVTELRWSRIGFRYYGSDRGYLFARKRYIRIPHWALVAASGTVLAWCLSRSPRRRRTRRRGDCAACGYDFRATPGRCPECGLVPEAPA